MLQVVFEFRETRTRRRARTWFAATAEPLLGGNLQRTATLSIPFLAQVMPRFHCTDGRCFVVARQHVSPPLLVCGHGLFCCQAIPGCTQSHRCRSLHALQTGGGCGPHGWGLTFEFQLQYLQHKQHQAAPPGGEPGARPEEIGCACWLR